MDTMHEIARTAIGHMPPVSRFREEDATALAHHRGMLLSWQGELVEGFYETVYAHPPTAGVFRDGERAERELTLAKWWWRTVSKDLDDSYFAWMAMVGLVHVIRRVSNPMMLAMADFVVGFTAQKAAQAGLNHEETDALVEAFRRLAATVGSIISFGYDHAVSSALFDVAGMPEDLLRRLRDQEVADALVEARKELQEGQTVG